MSCAIHEVEIPVPVAARRPSGVLAGAAARKEVRVMPVELRVVEEELDALPAALVGELLQRVALERRPVDDVVPRRLRREHREAIVVARRDRDVSHAGGLGERRPTRCASNFIGIERASRATRIRARRSCGSASPIRPAPSWLYTPQWMNIPKLASWNATRAASRSGGIDSVCASPADIGKARRPIRLRARHHGMVVIAPRLFRKATWLVVP